MLEQPFQVHKRRTQEDIIALVIHGVREGATLGRLIITTHMNYKQTKKYTDIAVRAGLIEKSENDDKFRITAGGIAYLDCFLEIAALQNTINQSKQRLQNILKGKE